MGVGEIYVKLIVGFPRDPKVRKLIQYGTDAGLARDLYVQMVLHCKENLTDGYVPVEEIGVLAYPLPLDHANQLAKQLASVGLIKEVSNGEAQGWHVLAYLRRNGSKKDVERLSQVRAEAGKKGGRPPRKPAGQGTAQANGNQVAKQTESRPNPYTETESETESKSLAVVEVDNQSSGRNARATEDPVIQKVQQVIYDVTDRPIDALWADWIRQRIAALAKDDDLGPAYFEKAIRDEPDPVGRFLEHEPPPPWCGECTPYRRLEDPETGDDAGRCPRCHPSLRKEPA